MNWDTLDWAALDRLRERFLTGGRGDYWQSRADLANYDFTFGERIGWKWDAVLHELARLGWQPPTDSVLDWGCGSGVAGRRVRDFFSLPTLRVFDRSPLAEEYAMQAGNAQRWRDESPGMLVVSHVLNELSEKLRRQILALAERAEAVLWVEPGTHADSRALITMREQLREKFRLVAPCTHQVACGMLTAENDRHWCHFFAEPPANIMADSNWVRFGQRAGIDLRSSPYSYLVLDQRPATNGGTHVIGEPRQYKAHTSELVCDQTGVREVRTVRSGSRRASRPASGT